MSKKNGPNHKVIKDIELSEVFKFIKFGDMEELLKQIEDNTEYLSTTENDEIECISVENLKGLLKKYIVIKNRLNE